jgi:hypothetical protein
MMTLYGYINKGGHVFQVFLKGALLVAAFSEYRAELIAQFIPVYRSARSPISDILCQFSFKSRAKTRFFLGGLVNILDISNDTIIHTLQGING